MILNLFFKRILLLSAALFTATVLTGQIVSGDLLKQDPNSASAADSCEDSLDGTCAYYDDSGEYLGNYYIGTDDLAYGGTTANTNQGSTSQSTPNQGSYNQGSFNQGSFNQGSAPVSTPKPQPVYTPVPQAAPPKYESPRYEVPRYSNSNNNYSNSYSNADSSSDSSANADSSSSSNANARADVDLSNRIDLNNRNYQTQSQSLTVNLPPATVVTTEKKVPVVQRHTREVVREVPTTIIREIDKPIYYQTPVQSAPQPVVQYVPQVVTVSGATPVKELPKTGLPLASLVLGALIPAGLRLRKFGASEKNLNANFIWEERELSR